MWPYSRRRSPSAFCASFIHSPASATTAWPTCAPNMAELIFSSIGSIWVNIARGSIPAGMPGMSGSFLRWHGARIEPLDRFLSGGFSDRLGPAQVAGMPRAGLVIIAFHAGTFAGQNRHADAMTSRRHRLECHPAIVFTSKPSFSLWGAPSRA